MELDDWIDLVIKYYFEGYSIKQAVEEVKKLRRNKIVAKSV